MAQRPRFQIAGSINHVTFRSVDEAHFFRNDVERRLHLSLVGLVAVRYEWTILGWCQMTTHGHLLIRTPKPNLSAGMQMLTSRYVRQVNEMLGRQGALVAKRFFSVDIDSQLHLLETLRYLPLNAPRGGICDLPEAWQWSSYAATIGLATAPPYLAVDEVLELFGSDVATARRRYEQFVLDGLRL